MMPLRPQSVPLAVQHVRNPRQRMPVAGIKCSERPRHPGPRQSSSDMRISRHILLIVIDQKTVAQHPPIHRQRNQCQPGADRSRSHDWDDLRFPGWDARTGILHARTILRTSRSNSIGKAATGLNQCPARDPKRQRTAALQDLSGFLAQQSREASWSAAVLCRFGLWSWKTDRSFPLLLENLRDKLAPITT